jgi:Flp pilus assembly protein TadD
MFRRWRGGLPMLRKDLKSSAKSLVYPWVAGLAMAAMLGACTDASPQLSHSALAPSGLEKKAGRSAELEKLATAHKADTSDVAAALAYAKALRLAGAKADALAVLETAAKSRPTDRQLALERGQLTLDLGDAVKAELLLRAAHDPKAPDWRLHSALGAALASRGKQREAQAQFAKALALAPDQPSVLNNLALSYALDGKAAEAEKLLRKVAAAKGDTDASRVQQNLALVLGLEGKLAESRAAAEAALPPAKVSENVAYLQMLAEARAAAAANTANRKAAAADVPQPVYRLGAQPPAGK